MTQQSMTMQVLMEVLTRIPTIALVCLLVSTMLRVSLGVVSEPVGLLAGN
jgi:hypothetical protein